MFRQYHYLNGNISVGAKCYVAIHMDKPVGFIAVARVRMRRHFFRVSRLVVLPDYQGVGVGKRLLNFVADLYTSQLNLPFFLVTSNPQLLHGNLPNWKMKRVGHVTVRRNASGRINRGLMNSLSRDRLTVTLEYMPPIRMGSVDFSEGDKREGKDR